MSTGMALQAAGAAVAIAAGGQSAGTQQAIMSAYGLGAQVGVLLPFSRSQESEADRIGLILMATLLGMALGGWMSGLIFDYTASYRIAFLNGIAWNLVNVSIMTWLLQRSRRRPALA